MMYMNPRTLQDLKADYYDDICRALTDYESPTGRDAAEDAIRKMYILLVDLQNELDNLSED